MKDASINACRRGIIRNVLLSVCIEDKEMAPTIYVDGSGSPRGGFGWFVKETDKTFYEKRSDITNNQAEYLAIISALEYLLKDDVGAHQGGDVTIFSDSLNTVNQLNREYAINNDQLRELAIQAWSLLGEFKIRPTIRWISRKENPAGKMLGS